MHLVFFTAVTSRLKLFYYGRAVKTLVFGLRPHRSPEIMHKNWSDNFQSLSVDVEVLEGMDSDAGQRHKN